MTAREMLLLLLLLLLRLLLDASMQMRANREQQFAGWNGFI